MTTTGTGSPRARLGLDLDGVVVDFIGAMAARGGHDVNTWSPRWDGYDGWGMDRAAWSRFFARAVLDGVFADAPALPGALEAIAALRDRYDLLVVTARPRQAWSDTGRWLDDHGLADIAVCFADDKRCAPVDILLDDLPTNVAAVLSTGRRALVVDQPWNRDADLPRVASLAAFAASADTPPVSMS